MKYEQEIIDELWLEYCRKHWPRPRGIKSDMTPEQAINQMIHTLSVDLNDGIQYIVDNYPK